MGEAIFMKSTSLVLSLFMFLSLGCSSDESTSYTNTNGDFDVNVTPISTGSWYRPKNNTSWQWQLTGPLNLNYNVDLYDVDLFDTNTSMVQKLHKQGKKVLCYFSGGSYESWRSDATSFSKDVLGSPLDGWEGERWLDISHGDLKPIMRARLDLAVTKGCDGVEADNMDGYSNNSGFALNANDQLAYNKFIANEAHRRGLAVALKNDLDQVIALEPFFDMSINEECHEYGECDLLLPFINHNKPVFIAEYSSNYKPSSQSARDLMCSESNTQGFMTLILALDLDDSYRDSCF